MEAINGSVQALRLVTGDLDARTRRPIAGGEHAHVGDVVVTRRNDRTLTSGTWDSVRNRDLWTVTATHPDGAITVTPDEGHGRVRLPADYVREHVRLGYAATEHGNQGVTTDTAYHLVTEATTARGLYVGATRGRDRNQLLVVTTDDSDARAILDRVLTSDRADTPAHVQRRTLHATIPAVPAATSAPRPRRTRVPQPAWLTGWRDALAGQRDEILTDRRDRETDRQQAAVELQAIQPELRAARQAWLPYQAQIDTLEEQLRDVLRPAMWTANAQARDAGFGHRRTATRRAEQATSTVHQAENAITVIRDGGQLVKHHLEQVQQSANRLERSASPDDYADIWENHANRLIDAIDTWTQWNTGRSTRPVDLAHALDILDHERGLAPSYSTDTTRPSSRDVGELAQPLANWLSDRGIQHQARTVDRGADYGIDL